MELLNRYLSEVGPLLPKEQRDDIVAELGEEIGSQIVEQERTLGRPLEEAEVNAILERFGHPMIVGGRYQKAQGSLVFGRELIGPELFPFYVGALKITFAISTVIHIAILSALSFWETITPGQIFNSFVLHFGIQFAVLTLVFCGMQSHVSKHPERWDSTRPHPSNKYSAGYIRFEAFVELIVVALFAPWLHRVLGPGPVSLGPAELAPIWHNAYWPIMLATFVTMAQAAAIAVRPEWVVWRQRIRAASLAVWLACAAYLLSAKTWVVPSTPSAQREAAALNDILFRNGLLIAVAFLGVALLVELIRVWKEAKKASQ